MKVGKLFLIFIVIFILDRLTKYFVARMEVLDFGILQIVYSTNTGAAFGIFRGYTIVLAVVSIIIIGLLLYYLPKEGTIGWWGAAFVIGGALGNLFDRIYYGGVIDFIDFGFWPSFNIADSFIVVGGVMLAWWWFRT